jgi:hypothetical protein
MVLATSTRLQHFEGYKLRAFVSVPFGSGRQHFLPLLSTLILAGEVTIEEVWIWWRNFLTTYTLTTHDYTLKITDTQYSVLSIYYTLNYSLPGNGFNSGDSSASALPPSPYGKCLTADLVAPTGWLSFHTNHLVFASQTPLELIPAQS